MQAPWSPRVGAGVVSQWFFNRSDGESLEDSRERLVLMGGYGGWPNTGSTARLFDGYISRPDSWHTHDGVSWQQLNWNNSFGSRAWMGVQVLHESSQPKYAPYPTLRHAAIVDYFTQKCVS